MKHEWYTLEVCKKCGFIKLPENDNSDCEGPKTIWKSEDHKCEVKSKD